MPKLCSATLSEAIKNSFMLTKTGKGWFIIYKDGLVGRKMINSYQIDIAAIFLIMQRQLATKLTIDKGSLRGHGATLTLNTLNTFKVNSDEFKTKSLDCTRLYATVLRTSCYKNLLYA